MLWLIGIVVVITILILFFPRFTIVQEGTAKAIMRFGGFRKIVMAWRGYKLNSDWNVIQGAARELPGGLRLVGIWWLDRVYTYNFRWQGIELVEAKEKVVFHEKTIDYILVKPDTYWTKIEAAETRPPERIPLDIEWLITMKVVNPYKTLFRAPPNWVEAVLSRFNTLSRSWVGLKKLDELLELKKERPKLWNEFKDDPLLRMYRDEWGIEIEENGIEIRDIKAPSEIQEAAAAQRRAELEAEATRRKAEIEAIARSAETVGTVIEMMAKSRGLKPKTIQKMIHKDPALQKEFLDLAKDLIVRKIGIEGGAYADIRVIGATGIERMILNALAAWKRMPMGKPPERKRAEKPKRRRFPPLEKVEKTVRETYEKK